MEIDGDEFAECDYGLVVDNSQGTQELNQKLDMLAQAALQNQLLDFSTIMKLYTTSSTAEKQRMVEANEKRVREQQEQQQQQQMQLQQQQMQQQAQTEQAKIQMDYQMHQEDNETKILVAQINSEAEAQRFAMMNHDNAEANDIEREKMAETARQFNEKLALEKKKQAESEENKK
jgi:Ca-activated chloride channel family protein